MSQQRHSPAEIRALLHKAETALGQGRTQRDVCRELGISPSTYRRWRQLRGSNASLRQADPRQPERRAWSSALVLRGKPLAAGLRHHLQKHAASFLKVARRGLSITSTLALVWSAEGARKLFEMAEAIMSDMPRSTEPPSRQPSTRSALIVKTAARKAAGISGGLALPGGPIAFMTIVPDLIAIWKIQSQMVADIAGAFGKSGALTREHMIYCLFKHAASQVVRDFAVRVGDRALLQRGSARIAQHLLGRVTLPFLGAAAVAGYAYFDTIRVGDTAVAIFSNEDFSR